MSAHGKTNMYVPFPYAKVRETMRLKAYKGFTIFIVGLATLLHRGFEI